MGLRRDHPVQVVRRPTGNPKKAKNKIWRRQWNVIWCCCEGAVEIGADASNDGFDYIGIQQK